MYIPVLQYVVPLTGLAYTYTLASTREERGANKIEIVTWRVLYYMSRVIVPIT